MIAPVARGVGQPDLPFLLAGLANYTDKFLGMHFTFLREAQARVAREVPGVWLAMGYDTADGFDLHPEERRNWEGASRCWRGVMCMGRMCQPASPSMKSVRVEGSRAIVEFTANGALTARGGGEVRGFTVAGPDELFQYADATIRGNDTVLEAEGVTVPVHVRYAWSGNPDANLVDGAGLPAVPFRNDAFEVVDLEIERQAPGREIKLDAYEARIDGDGTLWSIVSGGREFLAPLRARERPGSASASGYNTFFGTARLYNMRDAGPSIVRAGNETAEVTYRFDPDRMEWLLRNRGNDALPFRIAFADGVHLLIPDRPDFADANWSVSALHVVACLGDSALDITGIDRVFGPWDGVPVAAEALLKPGECRSLSVLPRRLTPDETGRLARSMEATTAGLPRLLAPSELAVFQRGADGRAAIGVSGRVALPCGEATVRLMPESPQARASQWVRVSVDAHTGAVAGSISAPAPGWYTLELRAGGTGNQPLLARRIAVGDVFILAGAEPRITNPAAKAPAGDYVIGSGAAWAPPRAAGFAAHLAAALSVRAGVPVGVVDIADAGAGLGGWEGGGARHRMLTDTVRSLGTNGFRALAWQPSPFDAFTSRPEYLQRLALLAASQVAAAGWEVPVRAGMFRGAAGRDGEPASGALRAGPVVNAPGIAWRDGALSADGVRVLAARWAEALVPGGGDAADGKPLEQ